MRLLKSNSRRVPNIVLAIFIIYISWNISGIFGSIPYFRSIGVLGLELLIILLFLLSKKDKLQTLISEYNIHLYLLAFICAVAYEYLIGQTKFILSYSYVYPFAFILMDCYLKKRGKNRAIIVFFIFDVLYKIIVTMYYYRSDPAIMKLANGGIYSSADGIARSVIQYSFMYIVPVIIILFLSVVVNSYKKLKYSALTAVLITITFLSQISMQIVIVPMLIILYLSSIKSNKISRGIIIFLIIIALIYLNIQDILNYTQTLDFLGPEVKSRIISVSAILTNEASYIDYAYTGSMIEGDTVVNRLMAYKMSLQAFVHNFFMGYASLDAYRTGYHSTWIDYIAQYSIWTILPLYSFIIKNARNILKRYPDYKCEIIVIYFYFLIIGLLNTISLVNIFISIFIIIPQFIENHPKKNKMKKL